MAQKYIIGDLVRYTSLYKEPIAEICEVHETSYIIRYMNENFAKVTNEEIKPIPLTPEILEKNGWKFYHGFYCSPNEEGVGMRLSSQTGYVWNACTSQMLLRSDINSVSDLQHLFFGLGINHKMEV